MKDYYLVKKRGQKIRAWVDPLPPLIRAMPERKRFFVLMSSLSINVQYTAIALRFIAVGKTAVQAVYCSTAQYIPAHSCTPQYTSVHPSTQYIAGTVDCRRQLIEVLHPSKQYRTVTVDCMRQCIAVHPSTPRYCGTVDCRRQ